MALMFVKTSYFCFYIYMQFFSSVYSSSPSTEEDLCVGLWCSDSGCLAFISGPGCTSVSLHALFGPSTQRHRPGRVWGILAAQGQSAAALLLPHARSLLYDPAAVGQHILLRHHRQPKTIFGTRGAVQQSAALVPEEEEDLHSAGRLRAGFRPVLAAPAGESYILNPTKLH